MGVLDNIKANSPPTELGLGLDWAWQCGKFGTIDKNETVWYFDIVTTPTQPQLNSTVRFDTKMTLHHHHHHKLNVINISAVPDPPLTKL